MKISYEHQLLRIQLLDAANLGAASGKVTLDRPTQVNACDHLPFLPDSALKGVWQAVWEVNNYPNRDAIFGREHDLAGNLIVGNGDLLAFPLLAANGERCWIFSGERLFKFLALEKLCRKSAGVKESDGVNKLLALICRPQSKAALGIPQIPALNLPFALTPIDPATEMGDRLRGLLKRWSGEGLPLTDTLLIVNAPIAKYLWNQAAEIRELTALNEGKTALGQALRRVELIPAGSIFLSFVTWLEPQDLPVPDHVFQFGAWEGSGLGYCQLSIVEPTEFTLTASQPITPAVATPVDSTHMTEIYKKISELAKEPNAAYKEKVRSAIGSFGWRLKTAGWEAALAFELAKARATSAEKKVEMRAHRWFLAALFDIAEDQITEQCQTWFAAGVSASKKQAVMSRWLWLRKYSELELEKEVKHGY